MLHTIELFRQLWILGSILLHAGKPGIPQLLATLPDAATKVFVNSIGDVELRVLRPAVISLGPLDFIVPERLTVGSARVLLVRGAVGDVAVNDNQRRAVARALRCLESP